MDIPCASFNVKGRIRDETILYSRISNRRPSRQAVWPDCRCSLRWIPERGQRIKSRLRGAGNQGVFIGCNKLSFAPSVLLTELAQCMASILFKLISQMTLWREAEIRGDFQIGIIRINQQVFCSADFFVHNILRQFNSFILLEQMGYVIWIVSNFMGNLLHCDTFVQMRKNIFFAAFDLRIFFLFFCRFPLLFYFMHQWGILAFHPLGKKKKGVDVIDFFCLLDIAVRQGKGKFRGETGADSCAACQGC